MARDSLDVAFVIQTYHAMVSQDPGDERIYRKRLRPWLESIGEALKPGGRLVIQDGADRIPAKILRRHLEGAGFETVRIETVPSDNDREKELVAVFTSPR